MIVLLIMLMLSEPMSNNNLNQNYPNYSQMNSKKNQRTTIKFRLLATKTSLKQCYLYGDRMEFYTPEISLGMPTLQSTTT